MLDQSDEEDLKVNIPRPSTNAAEISSRIDKVVREWATESQKLTKQDKNVSKQQGAIGGTTINNSSPNNPESLQTSKNFAGKQNKTNRSGPPGTVSVPSGKNKNLAKISNAFRKSLDPISKRDVRELISIPENEVENLEEEHDVRVKAHEAVFKNAIVGAHSFPDEEDSSANKAKTKVVSTNKKAPNNRTSNSKTTMDEVNRNVWGYMRFAFHFR